MLEREAFQEIDYRRMFNSMAKWVAQIESAERIPELLARAFSVATAGRPGPVVLALPEDMLVDEVDVADPGPYRPVHTHPGQEELEQLRELLDQAERPLVIVGGGKWSAQAAEDIAAFCEANELPVATAFRRQDYVDNRSRVFAGHVGVGIDPALATRVTEADLLLVVGPRLGEMTTGGYTLVEPPLPRQTLVHVHAGAEELGRVYQPALAIHAGSPEFAAAARKACVSETQSPARRAWVERARGDYLQTLEPVPSPGTLNMSEVLAVLRERLPEDTIVCSGAGNFAVWPHRFWQFTRYRSQLAPTSGAMGYGVPAAIAAKIVEPGRTVVCFAGDGDFLMSGQELATAVQERADVLFLVVDNGMFGTIRMHQEREYPGRVVGTSLTNPDFAAFAAVLRRSRRARRADGGARTGARAGARRGRPGAAASARRPGGDHSSHNSYGRPGGHGRPRANRDRMRLLPCDCACRARARRLRLGRRRQRGRAGNRCRPRPPASSPSPRRRRRRRPTRPRRAKAPARCPACA